MYLITGASRGIGRYLFHSLRARGLEVEGTYHHTVPESPDGYHRVDLGQEEEVAALVSKLQPKLKQVTLVHCAGISLNAVTHKAKLADWRKVMEGNLDSAFLLVQKLIPTMREEGFGRIILISSIVPQIGVPGTAAYAASKAGLWGLMKTVAVENASKGVTCNCLNLGYFNAGMIEQVPKEVQEELARKIPARSLGELRNVLNAVDFLVGSEYVTGTGININGGLF